MKPALMYSTVWLLMWASTVRPQDATTPEFHANLIGSAFVAGVNSDSAQERMAIVQRIYAESSLQELGEERLVGLFDRVRTDYGALVHHHSEITGRYLHIFAQSAQKKQWHDFQFSISEEPVRLQKIMFIADVAEPVYLPNGAIDSPFTLAWLDGYVDMLVKENDLASAILIARGDSIFYERYVGFADAARTRLVDASTRFNLASGNKMFTALAVMQLQNAGKLRLTDPVAPYIPNFPDPEFAKAATIHHLLSHTSGLGDFFGEAFSRAGSITEIGQMLPFVYDDSLAFPPGTGFQYSNSGYIVAGLVVEKVSGIDYFTYVRDHLCAPLGLLHTDSYFHDRKDLNLAERLTKSDSGWKAISGGGRGSSAGGGYSTARDMFAFARGLVAGRLVDRATLRTMTEPKNAGLEDSYPYGYGFTLRLNRNRLVAFGHGGIAPGVNFELQYFPGEDITMVLFCNQDNGAYDDLRKNIEKLITGDR